MLSNKFLQATFGFEITPILFMFLFLIYGFIYDFVLIPQAPRGREL